MTGDTDQTDGAGDSGHTPLSYGGSTEQSTDAADSGHTPLSYGGGDGDDDDHTPLSYDTTDTTDTAATDTIGTEIDVHPSVWAVFAWVGAGVLGLFGLVMLESTVVGGLFVLAAAVLVAPRGRAKVGDLRGKPVGTPLMVGAVVLLLVAGVALVPPTDTAGTEGAGVDASAGGAGGVTAADGASELEGALWEQGFSSARVEVTGDTLTLNYESSATSQVALAEEFGTIAGTYAGLVEEYPVGDLTVRVANDAGNPAGTFLVEKEDAIAFKNGEITGEEFARRVFGSINA